MDNSANKVMDIETAVERFVFNGCHISIGGFTINRNPMAAVYTIIRQGIKNLHLYAHSNGQGVDELIGAGCVSRLEIAYGGSGRFAPTCIRFKTAVQQGTLLVEDYSNYQMTLRFAAGAMGVPFLPTRSGIGTDIIKRWGFSADMRAADKRLPGQKLTVCDNPFYPFGEAKKVVLVPAINPDITIIHAQQADSQGTVRIKGLTFADIEQAKAARHVIVTCEKIVAKEVLRADPDRNHLPFFNVDAVVEIPMGAYPTACFGHYDYDPVYLNDYRRYAQNEESHRHYLDRYIMSVAHHKGLLTLMGEKRLEKIKADPRTGYAVGLERS